MVDEGEKKKFRCIQCDFTTSNAFFLKSHMERKHGAPRNTPSSGPSESPDPEPEEALDRKAEFIEAMKKAGLTSKASAIADLFFQGDVDEDPQRLVNLLKLTKADSSQKDILLRLWFDKSLEEIREEEGEDEDEDEGENAAPEEKKRKKEEARDPVRAAKRMAMREFEEMRAELEMEKVKQQIADMRAARQGGTQAGTKTPEQLVTYTTDDGEVLEVTVAQLIQLKRADAAKTARDKPVVPKKVRVLDSGATVEMSDEEWSSYQVQLSLTKRTQGSQASDTERLMREMKESHEREMRELKAAFDRREEDHRWTEMKKEMEETRAAAQHNPFTTYLEMNEMAQRAGLTTKPADQQRLGIEQTKVEKMLGGLLTQQQHHHRLVEEGVGAAKDILVEMKKAEIRAAQGLPPEEGQYQVEPAPPEETDGRSQA